jgi:tRNA(adenine34) deaminase
MENRYFDDEWFMDAALKMAEKAYSKGEVPVGAVVVNQEGKIISEGHNLKESNFDPTGHAEIIAIKKAAAEISSWRLSGCTIYVTLEPCLMCLASMTQSRVDRVVFGAFDPKGGAFSLGYHFNKDKRLNHKFKVSGGLLHYKCSKVLSNFFKERRKGHKK